MIKNSPKIMKIVAAEYGVTVDQMKGRSRVRPLPEARQMLCALLEDHGPQATAKLLNWDTTMFFYSVSKIESLMSVYKDVNERYHRLAAKIAKL